MKWKTLKLSPSLSSDNCGGKNKNHTIVRFCNALVEIGSFDEIHQIYPLRGHSFLPFDRAFGTVKRAKKTKDRIYTVRDVVQIIANCSTNFTVQVVNREDVLNSEQWWPKIYKRSCMTDNSYGHQVPKEDKVQFKITKHNQFSHEKGAEGKAFAKNSFVASFTLIYSLWEFQLKTTRRFLLCLPFLHTLIGFLSR